MLKTFILAIIIVAAALFIETAQVFSIDAEQDGPVYGDSEGLARVEALEAELHSMTIRQDHPRLFVTQETLPIYQARVRNGHPDWNNILSNPNAVNAAFAYLMLRDDDPQQAQTYADIAIQALKTMNPTPWTSNPPTTERRITASMALAFDWVYNAMTQADRDALANKIGDLADITGRAQWIRDGNKNQGETFHREEWIYRAWSAWPEIALANHYTDAELCYKSRWNYDWYWGDAARMYAYVADGTPFEGYYIGANGASWFLALKTAAGVNLIDDPRWPWCSKASDYFLYRLDFDMGREVFHHGVAIGAAGCICYKSGSVAWKEKAYMASTFPLTALTNPYSQWIVNHICGWSSWLMSEEETYLDLGYTPGVLFFDPLAPEKNPENASYNELPYAKLFPGGDYAFMRTGWKGSDTMASLRAAPAYTKTSHGDFDANTFVIYRKGVISPDSGVYDVYAGQSNYFSYQKSTVGHNDLLVIDPSMPNYPTKFSSTPDPGGTEFITTRSFGYDYGLGQSTVFVHNPNADWGDIVDFKTTLDYDYAVGEAAVAYGSRLNEYYRSVAFLRKGDKAYFIVFDRVEATNANYDKRWLMHFVTEPIVSGSKISEEVPGHIDTYDGDLTIAENAFGTAAVYVRTLLPQQHKIRRIGGEGYRFYVEGTNPTNYPITQATIDRIQGQMGGPWIEVGQWRIELSPQMRQTRDYFLNVMYIGDPGETAPQMKLVEEGDLTGVIINDALLPNNKIMFSKTGTPYVTVEPSSEEPDSVPPGMIQDLAVTGFSDCTADLTWTATGDDGSTGTASSYDLRYSTQPITEGNWSQAKVVHNTPSPQPAGSHEAFTVTGLEPETTYYLCIKAQDDWMNVGPISNIAQLTTQAPIPDTEPPSVPTGLSAQAQSSSSIALTWTASTDNKGVTGYKIYRDGAHIADSTTTSYTDVGLGSSTTYTYQVSAYDEAGNESGKSTAASATTKNEEIPPIISSVQSSNVSNDSATITWITDESATSQVEYGETVSYGSKTVLDSNLVINHSVVITGLSPDTTYHYRVISKDQWDNQATSGDYTFQTMLLPGQEIVVYQEGVSGQPYDLCEDAYIMSAYPRDTGVNYLKIQHGVTHGLISFPDIVGSNSGQIPSGAQILSAELTLQTYYGASASEHRAYRVLRNWNESSVCWNTNLPGEPWNAPGCDGIGTDRDGTPLGNPVIPSSTYTPYTWDIKDAVQTWADGEANCGVIIIQIAPADEAVFFHSEWGGPNPPINVRPRLKVSFIDPSVELGRPGTPQHVDD